MIAKMVLFDIDSDLNKNKELEQQFLNYIIFYSKQFIFRLGDLVKSSQWVELLGKMKFHLIKIILFQSS